MKIPQNEYKQLLEDIKAVGAAYKVDFKSIEMPAMWSAFNFVCKNRSYDDNHPIWQLQNRVLPYTGRAYGYLYDLGLNDEHIETALRNIKKELSK